MIEEDMKANLRLFCRTTASGGDLFVAPPLKLGASLGDVCRHVRRAHLGLTRLFSMATES